MALLKGRFIDPSEAIKLSSNPTSGEDVARKVYVDTKSSADAAAAQAAAQSYTDQKINDLINASPATLDTLKELADALGEDPNFATTIAGQLSGLDDKIDQEIADRLLAITNEAALREAGDSAEQSAREAADAQETAARQAADSVLDGKITTEKNRAEGEEERIEGKVDTEKTRAEAAEAALQGEVNAVEAGLAQEILDRQAGDVAEATARDAAISVAVMAEQQARELFDASFDQRLNQEVSDRQSAVDSLAVTIGQEITTTAISLMGTIGAVQEGVLQEVSDRQAAVSSEQSRAQGEESRIEGKVDQEITARQTAVSAEQMAREAGDASLQSQVNTEKGRVDAILLASQADKDSFAEIVQLINSVDTENDSAFASYVLSNNAALQTEQSARELADQGLQSQITQEVSDRQSAVSGEQSRAEGEESRIEGKVDQEISDRQAAVSSEQTAREAADEALDVRLDALEAAPQIQGQKVNFTLSAQDISNGYVEMQHEPLENTMMVVVSGMVHSEEEDYTLSTTSGVTRISFTGDLASKLQAGDKVKVQFLKHSSSEDGGGGGPDEGGGGEGGGGGGGGQSGIGPLAITNVMVEPSGAGSEYVTLTFSFTAPQGTNVTWIDLSDIWNGVERTAYTSLGNGGAPLVSPVVFQMVGRPSPQQSTEFKAALMTQTGQESSTYSFSVPRPAGGGSVE